MARRPAVTITNGQFASVKGARAVQAKIAALGNETAVNKLSSVINGAALVLAQKIKAVTPLSELDPHPGALRESVHVEKGLTELSKAVVVDARDDQGRYFAKHVEHGHRTPNGGHVPAVPFFWPSVRLEKKAIRRAVNRALRDAVKAAEAKNVGSDD